MYVRHLYLRLLSVVYLRIETQDMKVIYALLSKRTLTFSDVLNYVS